MKNRIAQILGLLLVFGLLDACSNTSSNGGGATLLTGRFVDGSVTGLRYQTVSQSGETNANGEFFYYAGETVSFYVGDILIGHANGEATLSPFDLAGITPPTTSADIRRSANRLNSFRPGTPLGVVTNIAVFLQTLDDDGDVANGIQIPAAMHGLATGMSLNFEQSWGRFPRDFPFRKLMAAGRAAGLWGGTRAIRNPAYALDALYASLGLTPSIQAIFQNESDTNADGTVDARNTYTYDANGNLTLYEYDSDADGTVDFRMTYAYDADGNKTLEETDTNADGTVDERDTYTYDANGNWTLIEHDINGDGTVDDRTILAYDANGNRTLREIDSNADGTVDARDTYTYDANGNRTLIEQDTNIDGVVDARYAYTYDANGNMTLQEADNNVDGTVDSRMTYAYDAEGNLTLQEADDNADGTVDYRWAYAYDANGNQTLYEWDSNADGTVDRRYIYTYDANGNLKLVEYDSNADGTVDKRYIYAYDANGNRTLYERDSNADGTVDSRMTYTSVVVNRWKVLWAPR